MRLFRRRARPLPELVLTDAEGTTVQPVTDPVASAVRFLAARLDEGDDVPPRLAFTSSLSGEGVTFVSRAFAAALARDSGRRVCHVDLNWWSPQDGFGEETDPLGISDVILHGKSLDEVILATGIENLSVLPAGECEPGVRSALARQEDLATILDELSIDFDHLVYDLPAVLLTSDALQLARRADATVLVVRQGATTFDQVESTLGELAGIASPHVAMNVVHSKIPSVVRRLLGL